MKVAKLILPIVVITGIYFLLTDAIHSQSAKPAIARIWQGRVAIAKADEYEKYLNEAGVPKMTSALGNLGMQILRRPTSDEVEFVVISYWESQEAIKKIVGDNIDRAISLPRDPEFLLEPVTTVRHYQIVFNK